MSPSSEESSAPQGEQDNESLRAAVRDDIAPAKYRTVTLVSFATENFRRQQLYLSRSAINVGFDYVACWNENRLSEERFFAANRQIFSHSIGFGCWLWKPYIIRYELSRIPDDSFLIYWDVGREIYPHRFEQSPLPLLSWCATQNHGMLPGVYVPQYGPNKHWTKRDCFVAMNCDTPRYWEHPQVQATFSIWQKNSQSVAFVDEWLYWCQQSKIITDEPNRLGLANFDGFVAHRHDQSILTNLVIKHGLKCFGDPRQMLSGAKDINNWIDKVSGNDAAIELRERKKGLRIRLNKTLDRNWWRRNINRGLSAPRRVFFGDD
jgi:hypothetical protein